LHNLDVSIQQIGFKFLDKKNEWKVFVYKTNLQDKEMPKHK